MQMDLKTKPWYDYAEHDIIELLNQSLYLVNTVEHWTVKFHDYSFVVFPAAKAYEGFLKKLFLDLGFMTSQQYEYKYFSIGKALNPELEKELRSKYSIYDKLVDYCRGEDLANQLWDIWRLSRNKLLHWFPNESNAVDFKEAKQNVALIINAVDEVFKACKISNKH